MKELSCGKQNDVYPNFTHNPFITNHPCLLISEKMSTPSHYILEAVNKL